MLSKLDHALAYAAMGIRVFPVTAGAKTPALKDWQDQATTDRAIIERWWKIDDFNIGLATGRGVMAIDADTKDGAPGVDSLDLLDLECLPLSFRTRTPSGGTHVLLKAEAPIANRVRSLDGYPGIDIRGDGGYVLGAGSTLANGTYEITHDAPLEPMPEAFKAILDARAAKHSSKTEHPIVELDHPTSIDKAVRWLATAEPAVEGEGGDQRTYEVAAKLRDFGLSEAMAFDVIGEWNDRCEPPWSAEDLATKIANAYTYATGTWGGKSAIADFDPVEIDEPAPPSPEEIAQAKAISPEIAKAQDAKQRRSRFQVFSAGQSVTQATATAYEPLVEGILNQNSLAVALGAPGAAKTFNLIDMGLSIASGKPWAGKYATTKGAVFYIATEGGTGIHRRIAAAMIKHDLPPDTPFFVLPASVDFGTVDNADAKAIVKLIKDAAEAANLPVRLVVVDTLARAIGGGDENSAQDMSVFIRNMDHIRETTHATVMIVHHTGKDENKGARGSTALLGAIDTEIRISSKGHISTTKQRDLEEIETVTTFSLRDQDVGLDPNGVMLHSAVVEYGSATDDFSDLPEDGGIDLFYEVFLDISEKARAEGRGGWVTQAECRFAYNGKMEAFCGSPVSKGVVQKWFRKLLLTDKLRAQETARGQTAKYNRPLRDPLGD